MEIAYLALGLAFGLFIGFIFAWFIAKYKFTGQNGSLPLDQIQNRYVLKEIHENLQMQADIQREDLSEKDKENRNLGNILASKEQEVIMLEDKLENQKQEVEGLQARFKIEFENIANRLLEDKSQKFTVQNQQQLNGILTPLKEKIKEFETNIDQKFLNEVKDRISLKKEIEQLKDLNKQLSQDANNLVSALKGDSKSQGDWGEFRLEMLLENAGLSKDIHYQTQTNFKDADGKDKRPDFIINLPEGKHLIIDSKVSLTAYEKYFNHNDPEKKQKHLKNHVDSIRKHIKDLNKKNYQQLYDINSPDYLLLFIPIEPAFSVALQKEAALFMEALDKNIVIVTTSTLLATMRTVSFIWKQEKQKHSVLEIARQSGMLYDKFVNFVDDLKGVGQRLDMAKNSYNDAMNKLTDSKKKGDTLVGRAERIKALGAKTSKSLPSDMIELSKGD